MHLLVYSEKKTPRIDYIFSLMIGDIAGINYTLTNDRIDFERSALPKLSYGSCAVADELHVKAYGLLDEIGLAEQLIEYVDYNGARCPFKVDGVSIFSFDIFSAGFYLVSRYEEYLAKTKDKHGRHRAVDSLAYRLGFLEKPVINQWALELRAKLLEKFPSLTYRSYSYKFLSTIDIDQAYAYRSKGIWRNLYSLCKDIKLCRFNKVRERLAVLFFKKKDPFDTFDFILSLTRNDKDELYFFLHLGDYGLYDKSIPWTSTDMKNLVQKLSFKSLLGIHPSYASIDQRRLKQECIRFNSLTKVFPHRSRQHYLRLSFPETYQALLKESIKEDYSMGYSDHVGFRASICTPFLFYDISKEQTTELSIYPFAIMDGTLKDYMNLTPEEASKLIDQLLETVRAVDGLFISIWHNHSLSRQDEWLGWDSVYKEMILKATSIS